MQYGAARLKIDLSTRRSYSLPNWNISLSATRAKASLSHRTRSSHLRLLPIPLPGLLHLAVLTSPSISTKRCRMLIGPPLPVPSPEADPAPNRRPAKRKTPEHHPGSRAFTSGQSQGPAGPTSHQSHGQSLQSVVAGTHAVQPSDLSSSRSWRRTRWSS